MCMCVCVCGKGVNSTLQYNSLVTKLPLTEGVGVWECGGNGVTGLSCL